MAITYGVELDLNYDGTFANADGHIGDRLLNVSWSLGMPNSNQLVSAPMRARAVVSDPNLDFSRDVGNSPFGVTLRGMMARITATVLGVTTVILTGWITEVDSSDTEYGAASIITIEDKLLQLQDAEYLPILSTNIRIDEELQNIFDSGVIAYPYDRSHWVLGSSLLGVDTTLFLDNSSSLEQARTTLTWVGDAADRGEGVSAWGYIMDLVFTEVGGRMFVNRLGKFVFHNRYHDLDTPSKVTFTASQFHNFQLVQSELFNEFTINYLPRQIGAAGGTLFKANNVPIKVDPRKVKKIKGRYHDPDNLDATVGGMDVISPVATTDYIANSAEDGTGSDKTSVVIMSHVLGATATEFTIENPTDDPIYITKLQVRGTPLLTHEPEQIIEIDPDSIRLYGRIPYPPINLRFVDNEVKANGFARQMVARFSSSLSRYEWIELRVGSLDNRLDTLASQVLGCEIGDKITVNNSVTGHNREYTIVGERHSINGGDHVVRWILRPSDRTVVWILGTSILDNDTVLAL